MNNSCILRLFLYICLVYRQATVFPTFGNDNESTTHNQTFTWWRGEGWTRICFKHCTRTWHFETKWSPFAITFPDRPFIIVFLFLLSKVAAFTGMDTSASSSPTCLISCFDFQRHYGDGLALLTYRYTFNIPALSTGPFFAQYGVQAIWALGSRDRNRQQSSPGTFRSAVSC